MAPAQTSVNQPGPLRTEIRLKQSFPDLQCVIAPADAVSSLGPCLPCALAHGGSIDAVSDGADNAKLSLEGKDFVVRGGDAIHFKFNV